MWSRKTLKTKAKVSVRHNRWKMIMLCLLMMFLTSQYAGTMSQITVKPVQVEEAANQTTPDTTEVAEEENVDPDVVQDNAIGESKSPVDIFMETLEGAAESGDSAVYEFLGQYHPDRGALAPIFNSVVSSGSILFGFLNAFNTFVFKGSIGGGIIVLVGAVIAFLLWYFVQNVLKVGEKRYFMEARTYYGSNIGRVLMPYHVKRAGKVAGAMFRTALYQTLWNLTIIGGFIKTYSYFLVPYIVAENPEIDGKTAIKMSRQMMNGYKWKTFVLDVSFILWNLLGAATMGIVSVVYVNPYRAATYAELYMYLRQQAKENHIPGAELLNDMALEASICDGSYPMEQFSVPEAEHRKWIKADYRRDYSIPHLILIFFIFSFIGWCWEVSIHLFQDGEFVNRGVLFGPWLPIYGWGGTLVLILTKKIRDRKVLTFVATVLICGCVEYFTSYYLEMTHDGMKWWDYSGYFLNINGRVCAEGLLVFGLGGCAFIYAGAPFFDELLKKVPMKICIALSVVLVSLFIVDNIHSKEHPNTGKGITDYESRMELQTPLERRRIGKC